MSKPFRTSPSMELLTELIHIRNYTIQNIAQATQMSKLTLTRVLQGKTQHLRRQNFCKLLAFYCKTLSF
jgi:DNA-binding Xre family transcriptional regulator